VPLGKVAAAEFQRLVARLDNRGMLERCDPGHITEAARVFEALCNAYTEKNQKTINQMTTQLRGLRRELGLTLHPSRSHVTTVAKNSDETTEAKPFIKIAR
jgi:phage terminase small subunit